ncbi:hypothetical protein [Intestinimonas butyriciproducens]|uniref:hypothetical protein n=1 Tax=Intestinimonas butyriciproducens TaxID=1297617 RepID=UPI0020A1B30B|nr:hypothetical protein [Intestinimonas butyriciproducens]
MPSTTAVSVLFQSLSSMPFFDQPFIDPILACSVVVDVVKLGNSPSGTTVVALVILISVKVTGSSANAVVGSKPTTITRARSILKIRFFMLDFSLSEDFLFAIIESSVLPPYGIQEEDLHFFVF